MGLSYTHTLTGGAIASYPAGHPPPPPIFQVVWPGGEASGAEILVAAFEFKSAKSAIAAMLLVIPSSTLPVVAPEK